MGYTRSPLRYPGGKSRLAPFIRSLIHANGLEGGTYVEPFAGAAGIAWALLFDGTVSRVILNDLDPALYAFWRGVFTRTDELCEAIRCTPVSMGTWTAQRKILQKPHSHSIISVAYAAFFLNRTNRSGLLRGGVIGGKAQSGSWRLDARFNAEDLIRRIRRIAEFRRQVRILMMDGIAFIRRLGPSLPADSLAFIDPPYFGRGHDLYWNTYTAKHHEDLSSVIKTRLQCPWTVSYDDVPPVRRLYRGCKSRSYHLSYSAARRYVGREVLFFSDGLFIPRNSLPIPP